MGTNTDDRLIGLLTRDWTTWRNGWVMDNFFKPMIKETFQNAQSV